MNKLIKTVAAVTVAAFTLSTAYASTPAVNAIHSQTTVMGFFHPKKPMVKKPLFAGNIIGNKNTHVYHMPGDPGALPAPQNRVYFHTQTQAVAAGYHRAGSGHGKMSPMGHHMMGSHTMGTSHHMMMHH